MSWFYVEKVFDLIIIFIRQLDVQLLKEREKEENEKFYFLSGRISVDRRSSYLQLKKRAGFEWEEIFRKTTENGRNREGKKAKWRCYKRFTNKNRVTEKGIYLEGLKFKLVF